MHHQRAFNSPRHYPSAYLLLHRVPSAGLILFSTKSALPQGILCVFYFYPPSPRYCGGFLSSYLLNRIDSILRKANKFGYTTEVLKVTDMLQNADNKPVSLMFRSSHCLHTLLPDLKVIDIVLRSSGTIFNCSYKLYKQSFVDRCLFRDCY